MYEWRHETIGQSRLEEVLSHPAVEKLKHEMIAEAVEKHGAVMPVGRQNELENCFTVNGGFLLLWFNVKGGTTKILRKKLPDLAALSGSAVPGV